MHWGKKSGTRADGDSLLEAMAEGVCLTDLAGKIIYLNGAAARILGYDPAEVLGREPHGLFHHSRAGGAPYPAAECTLSAVLKTGVPVKLANETFWHKGGAAVTVDCTAAPIKEGGRVTGLLIAFSDATARNRALEDLRWAKEEAERLLQVVPSAVYTVNTARRVLSWNREAEEQTGFSAAEVLGRECTVFSDLPCRHRCGLFDESVPKPIKCGECTIRTKSGQIRMISKNADLIRDERGVVLGGIESFEDITERRLAENRLSEREATFRAITSSARDAIIMMDSAGLVSFWNEAAERILGWKAEEALSGNLHNMIAPERFRAAHRAAFKRFVETGEGAAIGKTLELTALRKDGREIEIELSLSALKLDGKWCAVGIMRDITARKRDEALLRESQARLDLALRSSHMGVWGLDLETGLRTFDAKVFELLGIDPGHFTGREEEFYSAVHPDDILPLKNALRRTIEKGEDYSPEYRVKMPGGGIRYITARGRLERGPGGEPLRVNGVIWDCSEQKAVQEAVRASEDKYRGIFESFPDLYYQADLDGKILVVSPSVERLSGWKPEEAVGRNVLELYADPAERAGLIVRLMERGFVSGYEITLRKKDGTLTPTLVSARVRLDAQGRPVGVEGTLRDITDIKKTREELKKAKEAAEKASRAKSDFLANMSHEIRTPMNAIIGMSELLLDTRLDEEQLRHLRTIQRSADALLYIINDILDISRIEAGLMKLDAAPYSPRAVAESVAEMFAQRAAAKGLELVLKVSPDLPAAALGDGNRLRQILINLAGNAFKFTAKGQIKLSAEFLKGEGRAWLVFSCADSGVGISAGNQAKLFKKFSQVDDSSTRKYGGTGLGLSISKALVEMMGGSISLQSGEGKGSTFSFRLPYEPAPALPETREAEVSFAGKRALLVDDNPDSLEILAQNLGAWGFSTVSAGSSAEAGEKLKTQSGFDLLLVDHQMPGGDGDRFIEEVSGSGSAGGARIIMLSSMVEGAPEAVKPAVAAFLAKPITRSGLFNAVLKAFGGAPAAAATAAGACADRSHLRILVAEDNPDNQNLIRLMLEKAGYRMDLAVNGREALEKCAAFDYDLVLMDVQMPEMDGHEAAFQIRKLPSYKDTPIIALTAHGLESDVNKSLALGMNAHITKPLKKKTLYDTLDKWLDGRRKVLAVDDSADNLAIVEMCLKKEPDLRLYRASDGRQAAELARRHDFSLILMDVEMPVLGGLAAAREIRAREGGRAVPIVAFSAHEDPAKVRECLEAGCDDYLLKPVRKAALLEKVRKYVCPPQRSPS